MFVNIITPCTRPLNLRVIEKSINFPKENYRWIVVFDSEKFPNKRLIPKNCEPYLHTNKVSKFGNSQRNFAIDLVNDGHLYFNDDDTTIHSDLWNNIKDLNEDFIHFQQNHPNGMLRLKGDNIMVRYIDSHCFLVKKEIVKDIRFMLELYESDGYFAEKCASVAKSKMYIPKVLSVYNSLR